jgi:hypothetical protein
MEVLGSDSYRHLSLSSTLSHVSRISRALYIVLGNKGLVVLSSRLTFGAVTRVDIYLSISFSSSFFRVSPPFCPFSSTFLLLVFPVSLLRSLLIRTHFSVALSCFLSRVHRFSFRTHFFVFSRVSPSFSASSYIFLCCYFAFSVACSSFLISYTFLLLLFRACSRVFIVSQHPSPFDIVSQHPPGRKGLILSHSLQENTITSPYR